MTDHLLTKEADSGVIRKRKRGVKGRNKKHASRAGGEGGIPSEIEVGSPVPSIPSPTLSPSPLIPPARELPLGGRSARGSRKYSRPLKIRERLFLKAYLDDANPATFFMIAKSAEVAGYAGSHTNLHNRGTECLRRLRPYIRAWLDDIGVSEEKILKGIAQGLDCEETKFFAHQGKVITEKNVIPWHIRVKYLQLAAEVRGMVQHGSQGSGNGPVQVIINNNYPVSQEGMVGVAMEGRDFGRLVEKVPSKGGS